MDNLTHTLVGVALADLALTPAPSRAKRRLFVGAAVVAANAPDLDVLYFGITPPPLGYLLHHRGHTHTVLGLIAIGAVMAWLHRRLPQPYRLDAADRGRLLVLMAAALASHLLLDACNSYGVHPFHPIDSRWYYGDALFIFEPWIWVLLGVAVAWNAWTAAGRIATVALVAGLSTLLAAVSIVSPASLLALAAVAGAFSLVARGMRPPVRAGCALAALVVVVGIMIGTSRIARDVVRASLGAELNGTLADVILTPSPASPACWSVIAVEKNEQAGEFVLWRGTLSVAPRWKTPQECAVPQAARKGLSRVTADGRLMLWDDVRQPLQALRDLYRRDCWARSWLQFGRAPVLQDGRLVDARFDRLGANFSTMVLKPAREASHCPPRLTNWGIPRGDLLVDERARSR